MLCDRAAYAKLSAGRLRLWLATLQRLASVQGLGGVRAFFDQTESEKRFTLFGLRSRGHAQGLAQHAPNLAQNLVLALLDVLDACLKSEELALLGLQTMSTLAAVFNAQSASMRARALEKAHALYAVCQAQTHSATAYAQCKALFTL
jgi:hypothetical protein